MEVKCPYCNTAVLLNETDKFIIDRAKMNNLPDIEINCKHCNRRIHFDLKNNSFTDTRMNKSVVISKEARYRFTQSNVVKLEDVPVSNSSIKAQYYLKKEGQKITLICEDSFYSFYPHVPNFDDFLSYNDTIKKQIEFQIASSNGMPVNILNFDSLQQNWKIAKQKDLLKHNFIKMAPIEEQDKVLQAGDLEYSNPDSFLKGISSGLFYKEIFGQYLVKNVEDFQDESMDTVSNFFRDVTIYNTLRHAKVREDENFITFKKVNIIDNSRLDEYQLIKEYNELYKEQLGYGFTEFAYDYRVTGTINKDDNLIQNMSILLSERVKNNLSCNVNFELKRIDL